MEIKQSAKYERGLKITCSKAVFIICFLLTACSQKETSGDELKVVSSIPAFSYSSASPLLTDMSSSVSSALHGSNQTDSQQDEKEECIQIELSADDILEFGLTIGRLSGNPSEPSEQTVSITDTALIKEIVEKINGFEYIRDLEEESEHQYKNGISWKFWIKNRNGQKTTYQCSSYHYVQNGKWYRIKDGFNLLEYLKEKLNATW